MYVPCSAEFLSVEVPIIWTWNISVLLDHSKYDILISLHLANLSPLFSMSVLQDGRKCDNLISLNLANRDPLLNDVTKG